MSAPTRRSGASAPARHNSWSGISPSRYIHTSDAETYRPIAEIVEELNAFEADLSAVLSAIALAKVEVAQGVTKVEAREMDKALREILKKFGV